MQIIFGWIKKNIEISKNRCIFAGVLTLLFAIFWKVLPKDFSTIRHPLFFLFLFDCILCITLAVKVKIAEKWHGYLAFFLMTVSPAVCIFNAEYAVANRLRDMVLLILSLTYAICLLIFLCLYVITHRIWLTVLLGMSCLSGYALLNSFTREFRGWSIRAADIYAIRTAANVSGGYTYLFTENRACVVLISFAFIFLALHCRYKKTGWKSRIPVTAVTIVLALILQNLFWNETFMEENWVVPYKWELENSAKYHGAILEFVAGIPYLSVKAPEGYSVQKAEEFVENAKQNNTELLSVETELNGEKPDIIVIMNESYSDLRVLGNLEMDVDPMQYFYSLDDNVIRGNVSVPVIGGLTPNSEFEFLTGYSTAFFPTGTIAYQNYVNNDTHNLNDDLKSQGYYSIFMHPMSATGWNRTNVYRYFSFDEQLYLDGFPNNEVLRGMVTDRSNYAEVITRYEKAKETNDQVFIFNVTMQNHGGYKFGIDTTVDVTNLKKNYAQTEEYLTVIKESDQALEELITYFSNRENPVLICMFGDHQPTMPDAFYEELQNSEGTSDFMFQVKKYQTPFMIYTNYEIEEKQYDNISLNYLSTLLLETAELELNDYQKYLENLFEQYPVINAYGVKDADEKWHQWLEAEQFEKMQEYSIVQYQQMFD